MSENKKQAKGAQGATNSNEQKENVKSLTPTIIKSPAVTVSSRSQEDLLKEIKELTTRLSRIPQTFEAKAKFFVEKRELVKKHHSLAQHKAQLLDLNEKVEHDCEENDFESENFQVIVSRKGGYKDEEVVKIKNPIVIKEVIGFVIKKLDNRLFDYQRQIEA